ncbi:MAG: hypothetical protein KGH71_02225 [Candidatus Micrarchaeota archaeon]|nr:hypothetical protein [Candidatus Micrarchaeota archaeon]
MTTISKADHGMSDSVREKYVSIGKSIASNIDSTQPVIHFLEAVHANPYMIMALKQETTKYPFLVRKYVTRKKVVPLSNVGKNNEIGNAIKIFDTYTDFNSRNEIIKTANVLGMPVLATLLSLRRDNPSKAKQMLWEVKRQTAAN